MLADTFLTVSFVASIFAAITGLASGYLSGGKVKAALMVAAILGIVGAIAGYASSKLSADDTKVAEERTAAALAESRLKSQELAAEVSHSQSRTSEAEARIKDAELKIAYANARAAGLQLRYKSLKIQSESLVEDLTGRSVSAKMREKYKQVAGISCSYIVINYHNDEETRSYAYSLRNLLYTNECEVEVQGFEDTSTLDARTPAMIRPPFDVYEQHYKSGYVRGKDRVIDGLFEAGIVEYIETPNPDDNDYHLSIFPRGLRQNGKLRRLE